MVPLAGLAGMPAHAGVAPPGGFVRGKPHPFMPEPPGRYRTDLGWLIEVRDGGSDDRSPAPYVFVLSGG